MRISWTKLSDFSCKRRGFYKHEKRIELADASDLGLIYGAAVHLGFKTLFDWWEQNQTMAIDKGIDDFKKEFSRWTGEPDPKGLRTEQMGSETIEAFAEQWLARYPWVDIEGEKKYVIDLPGGHQYVAIIDRRGMLLDVKTIIEFKTTAWPHLFTIEPNTQVEGQAKVLEGNGAPGYLDALFILVHLSKNAKKGLIIAERARKGTEPASIFRPLPITLSPEKLVEWERDVLMRIDAIQRCLDTGYFPKETEHCGDYGGCPYKRLCVLNPEDRHLTEQLAYRPIPSKPKEEEVAG